MHNDKLELGTWNIMCQRCGFKRKAYDIAKDRSGILVCRDTCLDPRERIPSRAKSIVPLPWIRSEVAARNIPVVIRITGNQSYTVLGNYGAGISAAASGNAATTAIGTLVRYEAACPLLTEAHLPTSGVWTDIEYGGGSYVVCGFAQSTSNPTIAYSADSGVTWVAGVGCSTVQNNWFNVARLGSTWLVLAIDDFGGATKYQTSTDAVNWSIGNITGIAANAGIQSWTGLIAEASQSKFVLHTKASDATFYASSDGIAWTGYALLPSTAQWYSLATNGATIVIVAFQSGGTNTNKAAYSTVGNYLSTTWTASTLPANTDWANVIWTGTCYFATTRFSTSAARSYDGGATWEAVTLPHGLNNNPPFANTTTGKLYLPLNDLVGTPTTYYTSVDDGTTWSTCTIIAGAWGVGVSTGSQFVILHTGTTGSWDDSVVYYN